MKPIIFSVPTLTATVGQPYTYQVQARMGDPMEELKLALADLNSALDAYEQSKQQAQAVVDTKLRQLRDAINVVLGDTNG